MVDGKKLFLNLEVTVLRLLYLPNGSDEMRVVRVVSEGLGD